MTDSIQTLSELSREVAVLFQGEEKPTSIQLLTPLIKQYKGQDWQKYVCFSDDCYTRNYVYRDEDFEILVLCWQPGQGSPIHNHADRGCVLKVLGGELLETRYFSEENIRETSLQLNQITYIDNHIGLHKIENRSQVNTISLHIYSPGYFIPQIGDCVEDFGLIPTL
ncbi:MAG: cysteine dioxygenase family protein [Microscillaceae bacterium]|nr:cysteine dioxygenase family protein [Microscillaceae bacterium]